MNNKNGWLLQVLIGLVVLLLLLMAGYKVRTVTVPIGIFGVDLEKDTPTPEEEFTFELWEPATATFTFDVYEPPADESILLNTPEAVPGAIESVYFYFSQVSTGNYETGWNLLSETFKANNNPTGFEPYRDYWDRVDQVYITNATLVYEEGDSATVLTDLEYQYLDGSVVPETGRKINLKYEPSRQVWLFQSIE